MNTIRRLIYLEVIRAVAFVSVGFLALFFFFDFVDELQAVSKLSAFKYTVSKALLYVTLLIPSHLYELLPISVLIGTIFVMSRFAQSSEYTILRTSGLGPWRALRLLLTLGVAFVALTVAVGDYVAPFSDRAAQLLKARYQGAWAMTGNTGAWLRERQDNRNYAVNVVSMTANGTLSHPRIFEFDDRNFLISQTSAESARIEGDRWVLTKVERQDYEVNRAEGQNRVNIAQLPTYDWPSTLTADMVSVALLKPERMRTLDLFDYIRHLQANGQDAQRYEIQFWRKVFYPLSCLVMVVLALPFAYLHFRQSGIAGYVFGGVMIGISFFLLNNVFGYIGNLRNWWPWITAAAPGIIYSMLSLGAFGWLVLRR